VGLAASVGLGVAASGERPPLGGRWLY